MLIFSKNFCLLLCCCAIQLRAQQPAAFQWLDPVKCAKDQHTLALLRVGPEGFHLLRWQEQQRDYTGKVTPAYPVLTSLGPAGQVLASQPMPTLEAGSGNTFRFAVPNDSLVLFAYEVTAPGMGISLFMRTFDLVAKAWADPPRQVFQASAGRAFSGAWFSRSPDGNRCCIYLLEKNSFTFAVFDRTFRLLRQSTIAWPAGLGRTEIRQVFCTNGGDILLQTRTSGSGETSIAGSLAPQAWRPDGRALWPAEDVSGLAPFAVTILLIRQNQPDFSIYYPKIGKKYAASWEFAQRGNGPVLCAGFAGDQRSDLAETYFVYQIDLRSGQAEMLQNAPLTASTRRAFLSEKDAADKAPIPNLRLRWLDWAADGRPWLLAEQENAGRTPVEINTAALLRLDSTYKITAARPIEKYQRATPGESRFFGSVAAVPAPKGWWVVWNKGTYPSASLLLTDGKASGETADYELAGGARLVLTSLPHTRTGYDGKWYFVGESANGDRFGIGVLERAGKK